MTSSKSVRIAVDAMGGDFAPEVNLKGALAALREDPSIVLTLVGHQFVLERELRKLGTSPHSHLQIAHSEEIISMDDTATSAIRKKKKSSIHVGLRLVQLGQVDAFISAGNSGAVMAGAILILGRLPGVERPAILVKLPTAEGYVIILDVGANVDCRPNHLVEFVEMGHVYAEIIEGIPRPRIGLLSNGAESHKGNELTRSTHTLLKGRRNLNYIGYVEGSDLFRGNADVVTCDGFVGNVTLKCAEGLAESCVQWFRSQVKKDVPSLLGVALLKKTFREFKSKFDYQPYGAAPLLGINGMVLISHGSSTETAIHNGILTAKRGVEQNFTKKMADHLERRRKKQNR